MAVSHRPVSVGGFIREMEQMEHKKGMVVFHFKLELDKLDTIKECSTSNFSVSHPVPHFLNFEREMRQIETQKGGVWHCLKCDSKVYYSNVTLIGITR